MRRTTCHASLAFRSPIASPAMPQRSEPLMVQADPDPTVYRVRIAAVSSTYVDPTSSKPTTKAKTLTYTYIWVRCEIGRGASGPMGGCLRNTARFPKYRTKKTASSTSLLRTPTPKNSRRRSIISSVRPNRVMKLMLPRSVARRAAESTGSERHPSRRLLQSRSSTRNAVYAFTGSRSRSARRVIRHEIIPNATRR